MASLFVYLAVTFVQVWRATGRDEARSVDAILVLGAAQYNGVPSPVLAARLDHAADLFRRDLAPLIVVTGGKREGDQFTEAGAGAAYLESLGIPGNVIERETTSRNSWESLAAAARFLRADGITKVLLVSDPYHSFRVEAIADDLGLDASVSPTRTSPTGAWAELRAMVRETAAVAVGRIIGYPRLVRLDGELSR
ncbi:MAG: YdcF family protein [Acidimicrobiales bacterium]